MLFCLCMQAPVSARLPAGLTHEQYNMGLNRQLLPQGMLATHAAPQGIDGIGLSRGIDHFFPQASRGLSGVQAGTGHVPLLPLQVQVQLWSCVGILHAICNTQVAYAEHP